MIISEVAKDYAKIQKRNPMFVFQVKNQSLILSWGDMTYLEYKDKIEFSIKQIKKFCEYSNQSVLNFLQVWDKSVMLWQDIKIAKIGAFNH